MTMSYCHSPLGSERALTHVIVGSNSTAFEAQLQVVFDDLSLRRAGPSSSSYSKVLNRFFLTKASVGDFFCLEESDAYQAVAVLSDCRHKKAPQCEAIKNIE